METKKYHEAEIYHVWRSHAQTHARELSENPHG